MPDDLKQNQLFESVSALVDNQSTPLELQRILAHTEKNTGVRSRWHRYQLARAVLRGEAAVGGAELADKVKAAIANLEMDGPSDNIQVEDGEAKRDLSKSGSASARPWYSTYGRVAVAASVTLAVVLGSQQIQFIGSEDQPVLAQRSSSPSVASTTSTSTSNAPTTSSPTTSSPTTNNGYQRADLGDNPNLYPRLNVQNVSSASFSTPASNSRLQSMSEFQAQRQQLLEEEQVRQAIQRLMLEHAQQTTRDQSAGLMPFIRVSDSAIVSEVSQ